MRRQATAQVFGFSCGKKRGRSGQETFRDPVNFRRRRETQDHSLKGMDENLANFSWWFCGWGEHQGNCPGWFLVDLQITGQAGAKSVPEIFENEPVRQRPRLSGGNHPVLPRLG